MGSHTFSNGIGSKVNIRASQEFELVLYNVAYYATVTTPNETGNKCYIFVLFAWRVQSVVIP